MPDTSVITNELRKRLAQCVSGTISTISKVKYIAVGSGGDTDGAPNSPSGSATSLENEQARYEVSTVEYPVETTARYTIVIPEGALPGVSISEMALVSEDGALYAIRNTTPKVKDSDEELQLVFDLEF